MIELLVVVVIIGVLAAIAIPTYVGQQSEAKDTAAQAALRTAATAQQLHYAQNDKYAGSEAALIEHGFRQGGQTVTVKSGGGDAYCMQAEGGSDTFYITQSTGKPTTNSC